MVGQDADLARWLRKHCTAPVLLAANKAERRGASGVSGVEAALADATSLGFGDPVAISAESGLSSSGKLHMHKLVQCFRLSTLRVWRVIGKTSGRWGRLAGGSVILGSDGRPAYCQCY